MHIASQCRGCAVGARWQLSSTKSVVHAYWRRKAAASRALASRLRDGIDIIYDDSNEKATSAILPQPDQEPVTAHYLSTLYTTDAIPDIRTGLVAIRKVRGKGWGLATTRPVLVGELLLVCNPVAIVKGPAGQQLPLKNLLDHVERNPLSRSQQQAVAWLDSGDERDMTLRPPLIQKLAALGAQPQRLNHERIARVLERNAYGEAHQDRVLARLRKEPACSILGLWPEFSFINHSCAPNAVPLVVGDCMMVRATRDMPQRTEVTINYLGRASLAPLEDRQQDLESTFGFSCRCPRCRTEALHSEETSEVMERISQLTAEIPAELGDALATKDTHTLARLQQQIERVADDISGLQSQLALDDTALLRFHASAFDLFWYMMRISAVLQPSALQTLKSMGLCAEIAAAAVPGSELHTLLAVKLLNAAERVWGAKARSTNEARQVCFDALRMRYGAVDIDMVKLLAFTGADIAQEQDVIQ